MKKLLSGLLAAGLCSGYLLPAQADRAETKITDAELDLGVEYDSTLSVEELDVSRNNADTALLMRGKLNGQWGVADNFTVKGGYSYLGRDYRDFSEFDLDIHQLFVDAAYDFSVVTLGASHYYATAALDGSDLLDLNLTSLYASRLFDDRIFVRLAGNFRDKQFDGRPDRDADSKGLDADIYFFFNRAKTFVSVGLSGEDEDARSAEFDYSGITFKTKAQHRFKLMGRDSKLALSWQYTDRDYDNVTPLIADKRNDERSITRFEWEQGLIPHLDVVTMLEYGDYSSNLDAVNYSETVASVALRLKL